MAKKINNSLQLRREIFKKDSSLSDDELFSSSAYENYIQSLVNFFTQQLGRSVNVVMLPDKNSDMTACTNGNQIMDNPFGPVVRKLERKLHFLGEVGKICHEACHCLFTDFPIINRYLSGWDNSAMMGHLKWYPHRPEATDKTIPDMEGVERLEKMFENPAKAGFVCSAVQQLSNIIDDPYIESRGLSYFGGLFAAGIRFMSRRIFEESPTLEEMDGELMAALSQLLLVVRGYEIKYSPQPNEATETVSEFIDSIETEINLLKTESDYTVRCEYMNSILSKLVYLFPFPADDSQPEEKKRENKNEKGDSEGEENQSSQKGDETGNGGSGSDSDSKGNESGKSSENSSSGKNSSNSKQNQNPSGSPNSESGNSEKGESNQKQDSSGNQSSAEGAESDASSAPANQSSNSSNQSGNNQSGNTVTKTVMSRSDIDRLAKKMERDLKKAGATETADGKTRPVDAPAKEHEPEDASAAADNLIDKEAERLFEEMRDKIVEQMARDECERDRQAVEGKEAAEIAKDVWNDGKGKYDVNFPRGNKDKYVRHYESVKSTADKTFKRINVILKERQAEGTVHGFYNGKVTSHKLYRQDMRVFDKKLIPTGNPKLAVALLIDESGSMYGAKQDTAAKTAIVLEDVMRRLKVPCLVAGHAMDYVCCINEYVAFDSFNENQRYKLGSVCAGGGTNDAAGISYCAEKLLKRDEERKLLIVISDGAPNRCTGRFSSQPVEDTERTVNYYRKKGIKILGIAIDGMMDTMHVIYGNSMLSVTDWDTLPAEIAKILRKEVLDRGY